MKTTTKTDREHPIKALRRAGVPLACFETADPAATIKETVAALDGKNYSVMQWDIVRGLVGLGAAGITAVCNIAPDGPIQTGNPTECLSLLAEKATNQTLCFFTNAHRFINNETVTQAIWNLRDVWKANGSILVLLAPALTLPSELQHDVVVVSEPLPDSDQLMKVADNIIKGANAQVNKEEKDKVVDTLLGMSAFAAEQCLAMSMSKGASGIEVDQEVLFSRKAKMVEQTPGLSVWRGKGTFDDIGGLNNIKTYLSDLLTSGRNPVRCIGFIDEIEKLFAGASGDLSGVSQDQLRVFLTEMQDNDIPGLILIGPPGTGKSAIAKGAGAVSGAEVLSIDTGAMTGSLVGESQAKIRKAMATFKAVSQGKGLFIATCNKIGSLPPELRRRFSLGTFYVDLPNEEERNTIWKIWLSKYPELNAKQQRPDDEGWTGAEIKACCDVAYRTNKSLIKAAEYITPVCKSAADQIESLRQQASGRFISAAQSGIYVYDKQAQPPSGRKMNI